MKAAVRHEINPGTLTSGNAASRYRFLARQPILDAHGHVHAYELLFRNGTELRMTGDGDLATRTMIDNSLVFGLSGLTGGLPAFLNCTADSLSRGDARLLPSSSTVLEILETIEPNPEVVEACRELRAAGYRLALDDFVYSPAWDPLIRIAAYIKIDFRNTTPQERRGNFSRLAGFSGILVAEKVETHEEYDLARSEGFTLFQGYYFCQPVLVTRHKLPSNSIAHLRLLELLNQHPLNLKAIGELVKQDPSIAYRLFRLVNSPLFAIRKEVQSVESALLALGDDVFRRIAMLAVTTELNTGAPAETIRIALTRARFCETTSILCGLDRTEQYLLGLFSLLPAMLQISMGEAIANLSLSDATRSALLGKPGGARCPLQWLEFHEHGQFERCEVFERAHGLEGSVLTGAYAEALRWTDEVLSSDSAVRRP